MEYGCLFPCWELDEDERGHACRSAYFLNSALSLFQIDSMFFFNSVFEILRESVVVYMLYKKKSWDYSSFLKKILLCDIKFKKEEERLIVLFQFFEGK